MDGCGRPESKAMLGHQAVRAVSAVLFARQLTYAPPRLADCVAFLAVISTRAVRACRGPLRSSSAAATRALACPSLLALAEFFAPAATHAGLQGRPLLWLVLPLPRSCAAAQVGMLRPHSRPRLFPPIQRASPSRFESIRNRTTDLSRSTLSLRPWPSRP